MADKKISALTGATTPLAGTEVLPIVQSGATVKVAVSDLTAGRAVSAASFQPTSATVPTNGVFLGAANSVSIATNTTEHWMVNASGNLNPVGAKGIGTALAAVAGVVSTQFTSTVAIGTAPLVVTSTTNVANLNASSLNGATFAAPGAIGGGTASAITATTVNKVAITAPASASTLTIADGKTLTANNTLTLAGTDATTQTFPTTSATIARTDAAQTFTGIQTFSSAPIIATVNATAALNLVSTSDSYQCTIYFKDTVPRWEYGKGSTTSDFYFYSSGTSSTVLNIAYATGIVTMGAYGAGAATFSASGVISSVSDETWKIKDGVPSNPDAMLKKLQPGYWFYNEEKAPIYGGDRQLGFYAQNVNNAIGPEAAPEPELGKPWGYYDRSVLAIAVMSLQNALNTIEVLISKVNALEKKCP